jgi:hypothetical protein
MEPLFNKNRGLVGWIHQENYIFDTQMNCVAYIYDNHVWSSETNQWLGPIQGFTCFDPLGKPIAWNPKEFPSGIAKPRKPRKIAKRKPMVDPHEPKVPKSPKKPLRPIGGWSKMTWEEWLNQ